MFYDIEMIKALGYEDVSDFVADYTKQHSSCVFRICPDGVYADYDFDSDLQLNNIEWENDS